MTTAVLYPTNVHCADCVRDMINSVLREKPGIVDASYDADAGALAVVYQPDVVDEEAIRATVSELGYGFAESAPTSASVSGPSNALAIAGVIVFLIVAVVLIRILLGG